MIKRYMAACVGLSSLWTGAAEAQIYISSDPIDAVVPLIYNRGRNESVLDRPRPEVNQVGIPLGSFTVLPRFTSQLGYTSNVLQTEDDRKSDAFVRFQPRLLARSNWSLHSLQLEGTGDFVRYADQSARNENGWSVTSRGRYDVSGDVAISGQMSTARRYETQFSGASLVNVLTVTPYQQSQAKLLGDARFGRLRAVLSGDYTDYDFKSVRTLDNVQLSQDGRDRKVARGAGQFEYGLSPDAGVFVQLGYTDTSYRLPLTFDLPSRSSNEVRALAGVTFDLTALMRGSFGAGYISRNFDSPAYKTAKGLTVDAKLEYFPTPLTTATLAVNRTVQDATLASGGYFNTTTAFRLDHELLRTLLLNYAVSYEVDSYIGIPGKAKIGQVSGGARYLVNRLLTGNLDLTYANRKSDFVGVNGPRLSEFRALVGIAIHP